MKLSYPKFRSDKNLSFLGRWCLLSGAEHRLKRDALERLRKEASRAAGGEEPDWESLEGPTLKAADLLLRAQTGTLLAGARVVVVNRAERIPADEQETLSKAVADLPPAAAVVLVTAETGSRRTQKALRASLQRVIEKHGLCIEFAPLKGPDAEKWVMERAGEYGKRLERAAARKLAEQKLGTSLAELENEVAKLASYVGDRPTITSADVDEVTPRLVEEAIFGLTDAVAKQQPARAVTVLRAMLRDRREAPAGILAMIAQAMREIWQFKVLLDHGWRQGEEPPDEVKALLPSGARRNALKRIAGRQWQVRHRINQANSFSWSRLTRALRALNDCDLAMKGMASKVVDANMAIELLVVQLCRDLEMPLWDSGRGRRAHG